MDWIHMQNGVNGRLGQYASEPRKFQITSWRDFKVPVEGQRLLGRETEINEHKEARSLEGYA